MYPDNGGEGHNARHKYPDLKFLIWGMLCVGFPNIRRDHRKPFIYTIKYYIIVYSVVRYTFRGTLGIEGVK